MELLIIRLFLRPDFSQHERMVKKRSFTNFCRIKFIEAIQSISFWKIYSCNDVNAAVKMLSEELTTILDSMAPIKVFQVRKNYAPWVSKSTKQWMKFRDMAFTKASETQSLADWTEYKNLKATLNKEIHINKTNYINKRLDDSNNRWSTLQDINSTKGVTTPRNIIHNNKIFNNIQQHSK